MYTYRIFNINFKKPVNPCSYIKDLISYSVYVLVYHYDTIAGNIMRTFMKLQVFLNLS